MAAATDPLSSGSTRALSFLREQLKRIREDESIELVGAAVGAYLMELSHAKRSHPWLHPISAHDVADCQAHMLLDSSAGDDLCRDRHGL